MTEKEKLITSFMGISRNEKIDKLNYHKKEFERYLLNKEDSDIRDLINVTNALLMYFETGDRSGCKYWVNEL